MQNLSWFLCILLNVTVSSVHARVLKVAFGQSRPPYVIYEKGVTRGIEAEVVGEILRRMGFRYEISHLSSLRLEAEAQHGNSFDLVVGAPLVADGGGAYYSDEYVSFENQIVVLKRKNFKIKSIKDLTKIRLGAWLNAWKDMGAQFAAVFGPDTSGKGPAKYKEYQFQEEQVLEFWQDKLDAVLVDRNIFGWYRITLSDKVDTSLETAVLPVLGVNHPSYIAFKNRDLRDAFNHQLLAIRKSGEYERILRRYRGADQLSAR